MQFFNNLYFFKILNILSNFLILEKIFCDHEFQLMNLTYPVIKK